MSEKISKTQLSDMQQSNNPREQEGEEGLSIGGSKSTLMIAESELFSGPVPHPQLLKQYEEALPGAAERIMSMAEKEQEHRQRLEVQEQNVYSSMVESDIKDSKLGIHYSFILGLAPMVMGLGIVLVGRGESSVWIGGLFGVSGFATVVATMLKSTRAAWKEKQKKNE